MNTKIGFLFKRLFPYSLTELLSSQAVRDTAKVFVATSVASGIGLIGSILIIRALSVEEFGSFAFYNNITTIVSGLILSGLNLGFVRYLSLFLKNDPSRAKQLVRNILRIEIIFALVMLVVGLVFSRSLAVHVFGKSSLHIYLALAGFGVLSTVLMSFFLSIFQSQKIFNSYSLLTLLQAVIANAAILVFSRFHALSGPVVVLVFLGTNALVILMSLILYRRTPLAKLKPSTDHPRFLKEILHYSKWLMVIAVAALLFTKLDTFMLTAMTNLTTVGIYSFSYTVYGALLLVVGAINTIIFPNIAEIEGIAALRVVSKKIFGLSWRTAICIIPFFFLIRPAVGFVFGTRYYASMPILYVMLAGLVISICLNPVLNLLLILHKQRYMAYVNILVLIYHVIGNLLIIPRMGAMGAAIITMSGIAWSNIFMAAKLWKILHEPHDQPPAPITSPVA